MRGVRLPVNLDQRVRDAADAAGVKASTLIREWIELGLTELENDRPVSLSAPRRPIAAAQAQPRRLTTHHTTHTGSQPRSQPVLSAHPPPRHTRPAPT
ncbi:hypothetical protein [Micromonospora olivasterospora]